MDKNETNLVMAAMKMLIDHLEDDLTPEEREKIPKNWWRLARAPLMECPRRREIRLMMESRRK